MSHNLVTENYMRLNFSPKSGVTPGMDDHVVLNCNEILARYNVKISPSTGNYCPRQNEITALNMTLAQVYTDHSVSGMTATSVYVSGVIGNYTSIDIVEFGICYIQSNSTLPTTANNKIVGNVITQVWNNGVTAYTFSCQLTGLPTRELFTARAYVITPGGTTYGPSTVFSADYSIKTYEADGVVFRPAVFTIGEEFSGGRIFYIVPEGGYGYNHNIPHCYILSGLLSSGSTYEFSWGNAITLCQNSTYNGYTDWVLVDLPQQVIAYRNLYPSHFQLPYASYWTSIDAGTDIAWGYNLGGGGATFPQDDDSLLYVLAQRFF